MSEGSFAQLGYQGGLAFVKDGGLFSNCDRLVSALLNMGPLLFPVNCSQRRGASGLTLFGHFLHITLTRTSYLLTNFA